LGKINFLTFKRKGKNVMKKYVVLAKWYCPKKGFIMEQVFANWEQWEKFKKTRDIGTSYARRMDFNKEELADCTCRI
jgi:hypothetical protein